MLNDEVKNISRIKWNIYIYIFFINVRLLKFYSYILKKSNSKLIVL